MRTACSLGAVILGALAVATQVRDAQACGGCFHEPNQSGTVVTDHRMIFRVSPQATTLYDEIQYQGAPQSFAWVLPIHGPVTVGLSSDVVFSALEQATQTQIEAPYIQPCPMNFCDCGGAFAAPGAADASASADAAAVTVTAQQTVGPYDTVQLQSTNPQALNTWLTTNGYAVPADVQPIISAYVGEGFDFLALRLSPGQGVSAMRPVRVTSSGAGVSLPLRMVAAGTGATVGLTLWVVADGRYEPQNFPAFTVSPSELTWDFAVQSSDYATVRAKKESALKNAAWQIESSLDMAPYRIESSVLYGSSNDYLPIPAPDGGAGDAGGGETSDQARQDDLATLFPGGNQASVRITRMRADLSHAALTTDLVLRAAADQSQLSNLYPVTNYVNAPTCPPVQACPPCPGGSSGASSSSGVGIFPGIGGPASSGGSGAGSGKGMAGQSSPSHAGQDSFSCSGAPGAGERCGWELWLAGAVAAAVFSRTRRTRTGRGGAHAKSRGA